MLAYLEPHSRKDGRPTVVWPALVDSISGTRPNQKEHGQSDERNTQQPDHYPAASAFLFLAKVDVASGFNIRLEDLKDITGGPGGPFLL